jgi:hypothetical protein
MQGPDLCSAGARKPGARRAEVAGRGTYAMTIIDRRELERLVQETFPAKRLFSAVTEFDLAAHRAPVVISVHGGPDPFLDRAFDAWLNGSPTFVALYQLLNRLCRAGALAPGHYVVTLRAERNGPLRQGINCPPSH